MDETNQEIKINDNKVVELKGKSISLRDVDWNNLSLEDFTEIEQKLVSDAKKAKALKARKKREIGTKTIKIGDKYYDIKIIDYNRLLAIKSEKSKEKFKEKILQEYTPIETL